MKSMQEVSFEVAASQYLSLTQQILELAKKEGASAAEVNIGANQGFSVSVHDGDVETVEYHQDKAIDITVFFGKRLGAASLSDVSETAIKNAVLAACHIAKFTDEDKASGLADREDLAFTYQELELAYPWAITVEEAIKLACECERIALTQDPRIMSAESVNLMTSKSLHVHANSLGFIGQFPYTRHEISCILVGKDKNEMQRDYSYSVAADPNDLVSINHIAKEAAERTVRRLGARSIKTIKAPVIFLAEEARGFLGHFVAAIQGGALYRKSSFLVDHLGKKIFPDFIHLAESPHLDKALGSAPFDNDGVATRPNVFVNQGTLEQYSLGTYAARKLGMKTTGNAGGVHNLIISHSDCDLKTLIKNMHTGLLVTEMMGNGVNLLTGDYSRGVGGFWVENGEIQFPVQEITIAGKLQDMYSRIVTIGNDIDMRGNVRTGSILLEEVTIAGT